MRKSKKLLGINNTYDDIRQGRMEIDKELKKRFSQKNIFYKMPSLKEVMIPNILENKRCLICLYNFNSKFVLGKLVYEDSFVYRISVYNVYKDSIEFYNLSKSSYDIDEDGYLHLKSSDADHTMWMF